MENLTESEIKILNAVLKTNPHSYGIDDFFQDNAPLWLEFDGAFISCYGGSYGQKNMAMAKYKASSGISGSQQTSLDIKDSGTVPEGKYWVLLMPDTAGRTVIYPGLGSTRAKLFADKTAQTLRPGNFYLHNSPTGYANGCIGTSSQLFDLLIKSRLSFTKIALMVDYQQAGNSTSSENDK